MESDESDSSEDDTDKTVKKKLQVLVFFFLLFSFLFIIFSFLLFLSISILQTILITLQFPEVPSPTTLKVRTSSLAPSFFPPLMLTVNYRLVTSVPKTKAG